MTTIVFLDRGTLPAPLRRPGFPHEWQDFEQTFPEETGARLANATIAITNKVKLGENELYQAPKLKFITLAATGYDCVDVAWCRAHGIVVSNVPGYIGASVPEHVFMLILALRRSLLSYRAAVKEGRWQAAPFFAMFDYPVQDLAGSTLGLVGYGQIAREVEKRALAFGMTVLIHSRKFGFPLEDVLRQADILSLHCPLTPETRHLIGAKELALVKKDAILINTARGGLVDEAALAEALKTGRLGGAGIDVLGQEPPRDGNPLLDLKLPNLIVTPHIAWTSQQSFNTLARILIDNIEAFIQGKPQNVVN